MVSFLRCEYTFGPDEKICFDLKKIKETFMYTIAMLNRNVIGFAIRLLIVNCDVDDV